MRSCGQPDVNLLFKAVVWWSPPSGTKIFTVVVADPLTVPTVRVLLSGPRVHERWLYSGGGTPWPLPQLHPCISAHHSVPSIVDIWRRALWQRIAR